MSRQVVSEKSRRLQREKKVSESANPDTQLIHCQNFINNTYSSLKSTKSFFRISDTMTFCRENLMNNSEIGEVVRKPSCEPKNCLATRATLVGLVKYCLWNPNLVSEFLVACYATLHPALSVRRSLGPSVGPSVTLYFFGFFFAVFGLTAPAQMIK